LFITRQNKKTEERKRNGTGDGTGEQGKLIRKRERTKRTKGNRGKKKREANKKTIVDPSKKFITTLILTF
jgi:hypothetical protein